MTPRQLMALADQHREHEGTGPTSGGQPMTKARSRPVSTAGSAGWLMAVSDSLERTRTGRVNAVG
jgi:hypothetical protein